MSEIPYYEDRPCRFKKLHSRGYKNIYTVEVDLKSKDGKKSKSYVMPYGRFTMAFDRSLIEISSNAKGGLMRLWKMKSIKISVATYVGTKRIGEEVLKKWYYKSSKDGYRDVQEISFV